MKKPVRVYVSQAMKTRMELEAKQRGDISVSQLLVQAFAHYVECADIEKSQVLALNGVEERKLMSHAEIFGSST